MVSHALQAQYSVKLSPPICPWQVSLFKCPMAGPTSMPDLQQEEQDGITALREEPAEIEDNALSEWDSLNLLSLGHLLPTR